MLSNKNNAIYRPVGGTVTNLPDGLELTSIVLNVGEGSNQVVVVGTKDALRDFDCDGVRDFDSLSEQQAIIEVVENMGANVVEFVKTSLKTDPSILTKACRFTNGDLAIAHFKDLLIDLFGDVDDNELTKKAYLSLECYRDDVRLQPSFSSRLYPAVKAIVKLIHWMRANIPNRFTWIKIQTLEMAGYTALVSSCDVMALSQNDCASLISDYKNDVIREIEEQNKKVQQHQEDLLNQLETVKELSLLPDKEQETREILPLLVQLKKAWFSSNHDSAADERANDLFNSFIKKPIKGKPANNMCMWAFLFADVCVTGDIEGARDGQLSTPLFNAIVDLLSTRFKLDTKEVAMRLDDAVKGLTGHEWDN